MSLTLASLSSLLFMAFVAVFLAIRGFYTWRMRREKAISKADLRDRVLIGLVGLGQVFLPILHAARHVPAFADRPQLLACATQAAALMVLGLWFFRRSHVDLGDSWSITLALNADHRLVTNGVYQVVRHPMYASLLLLGLGQALLVPNWIAGLSGIAALGLLIALRLPREEAMMTERFGDEYRDYQRRVGALWPRPKKDGSA